MANESAEGNGPKVKLTSSALAGLQGNVQTAGLVSLPHASLVDSDTDLIGAESDHKFGLSKLKRPVRKN